MRVALTLVLAALGSLAVGLSVGRGDLHAVDLQSIFLTMRAYRTGVAFLSGAALAVGGVIVQGLFRNPLASPSIMGTTAGATLGGQLALFLSVTVMHGVLPASLAGEMLIPLGCLLGAFLSLGLVLILMSARASTLTLILTGFVLNTLLISIGSLLPTLSQESWQLARALNELSSGSVAGAGAKQLGLGAALVLGGTLPAWGWSSTLDLLLCGEEEARALGVDVAATRFWAVLWASVITAGAVAMGGNVLFVGLIVPHALRPFVGERHHLLMPASFLAGGTFVVLCDAVCRTLPLRGEIPLSIVSSILGAPIFLWMLRSLVMEGKHA